MGNNSKPEEAKRKKKKGRPSLLDLQKRTLRLQKLQSQNPNPNPNPNPNANPKPAAANPYIRFPAPSRRSTRRNPNPDPAAEEDEEEEEGEEGGRKEKKLRFVLRLPHQGPDSPSNSAESSGGGARKRRIGDIGADRDQRGGPNSASKATDGVRGQSDPGPTTSLPDKKLLVFILDRLQKKDTYGVFSEPVDPEELPDYHDIIKHPMDFATIRKKLADGVYANLEQFENDVFLITSNAMCYNSSDTIYYRQARAIEELAKKDFENLRQESDDSEPEQKPRRGRPPIKNIIRKKVGRPPSVRPSSDPPPSDATLANAGNNGLGSHLGDDLSWKGPDAPRASYGLRNIETRSWLGEQKSDRNEDFSGSAAKGFVTKYGKKPFLMDEFRRNTYTQRQQSTPIHVPPLINTFDVDRKQLVPVGLQIQHTYARSLARFAAKLGPIGWQIAAKRIERVLPPGTEFGPGWVGENEAPQHSHLPLAYASPSRYSILQNISPTLCTSTVSPAEPPSNSSAVQDHVCETNLPTPSLASNPKEDNKAAQPTINGFNTPSGFTMVSQTGKVVESSVPRGSMGLEPRMIHGNAIVRSNNTRNYRIPESQHEVEKAKSAGSSYFGAERQGVWRGFPQHSQRVSDGPPDLNVGFQSPGSPTSKSVLVDEKQPDLALQL